MTRAGLILAVCGLALAVPAGVFGEGPALAGGWLAAMVFCLGLSLGALGLGHIHALTGGRWGERLQPPLRALAMGLPVALLLSLPLVLVPGALFPWTAPAETLPEVVRAKLPYLNLPFLYARAALCAVAWLILALRFATGARGGAESVVSLIVLALTVSVFDIDWLMAPEPEFYSTIHPLIAMATMMTGALAAGLIALDRRGLETERKDDLGKLAFGFLLLWAYLHYMQWLIVWSSDLPHEIHWYLDRARHGWGWLLGAGLVLNIGAGVALAWRSVRLRRFGAVAALLLAGQGADVAWRVLPAMPGPGWAQAGAAALALGLWLAALGLLRRREARHA
ncbi:hypothetical protein P1J78_18615 [Psychromarinibacter sp. C21-152]|uniref:Quinol:cytochrome c oxidoreductase quinone-binding subunit 2 n=1 Tax=Psychromarinibacter sediminicola TaxID=3033385 RepID=A0AAE3NSK1_9RHOB|nr:hypothetical protein [Psychromarinibacter sediminicola]MDF0602758.1 hypothetical protein [Psychromarinibacter sediminicola]